MTILSVRSCAITHATALSFVFIACVIAGAQTNYTCEDYKFFTVDQPGASQVQGVGINRSDTVVGFFTDENLVRHGFFRHKRGGVHPYTVRGAESTTLNGINDDRTVVGSYDSHAFKLAHRKVKTIDFPGSVFASANGINDRGHIVGTYNLTGSAAFGFLLRHGHYNTLAVPGAVSTIPTGINDRGIVVGRYFTKTFSSQGFVFLKHRYVTLNFPGALNTFLGGINDSGSIAGSWSDGQGGGGGFVYKDGKFLDTSTPHTEIIPQSINRNGDITGIAVDNSGTATGFLGTECHGSP
jgi:uncharacterized membrane protein